MGYIEKEKKELDNLKEELRQIKEELSYKNSLLNSFKSFDEKCYLLSVDTEMRYTFFNLFFKDWCNWVTGENPILGSDSSPIFKIFNLSDKINSDIFNRQDSGLEKKVPFKQYEYKLGNRYYQLDSNYIFDYKNNIVGCIVTIIDVSDKFSVSHRLQESEEKFRLLFETASIGIIILDESGKLNTINKKASKVLGFNMREIQADNLNPMDKIPGFTDDLKFVLDFKRQVEAEVFYTDNNKPLGLFYSLSPLHNSEQEVVGIQVILNDITIRKQQEQKKQKYNRFIANLLDTIPTPLFYRDLDGVYKGVNKSFLKLAGKKSEEEIIGKKTEDIFDINGTKEIISFDDELIKTGRTIHYEANLLYANGQMRAVLIYKSNYESPAADGILGVILDITERKRVENALRLSEKKLKNTSVTKDKLFSIIAHDLRGPISNFNHVLDLIQTGAFSNEEQDNIIAELSKSMRGTSQLLENLLSWSLAQQGKIESLAENFNISQLINENLKLFSVIAANKSINLAYSIPDSLNTYADPNLINIVLRNLISNAIKFTENGGTVEIVAIKKSDEMIKVVVTDTGLGIKKSEQSKIFNLEKSFVRRGTNNEKGTGLGLILCHDFIRSCNGTIRIESNPGKGSRFIFTLPCRE